MGFARIRRRIGGRSLAAAFLGTTFLVGLAGPALADSHFESENAELRSQIEDLRQEVQILKNMVLEQNKKVMDMGEPAAPPKTVKSGKSNVSLSVSGQVNRMLLQVNDGNDSQLFHADNDMSSTRVRFEGKAKMGGGWSAGATAEVQMESNSSAKVTMGQSKDVGGGSFSERKLEVWFKNKNVGKFSIGQGSTASDGTVEEDLSGTGVIAGSGFAATGESVEFTDAGGQSSGVSVGDLFGNRDGRSRKDRLRYDSPSFRGFQVSASHESGAGSGSSPWDAALRYGRTFGDFEVAAALSTWTRGGTTGLGASASILAPSGTSVTGSFSDVDDDGGSSTFTYLKLGQELKLNAAGKTAVSIGFASTDGRGGGSDGGDYFDVAVVQKIKDLGAELYGVYGVYSADIAGISANDIRVAGVGARIKF